jgi:menaquinone-specific isochorismate synthase
MENSLPFLQEAQAFPKFYWKSRGASHAVAGYGTSSHAEVTLSAQAFSTTACQGVWSECPTSFSLSPAAVTQESYDPRPLSFSLPQPIKRSDTPTFSAWKHQVEDALHQIEQGRFQKVVLARQTTLSFSAPPSLTHLMRSLNHLGSHATLFMLNLNPHTTFMGASPEKLFCRKGRTLFSEALAGTKTSHESWGEKEMEEFAVVQKFLRQKFSTYCTDVHWLPREDHPFADLQHLYQKVEGVLNEDISDETLIASFHPTPALGGFPSKAALDYLEEIEPIHRGWYGSPLGLFSPQESDVAVAIRSALICHSEMHLFAGLGIVKGSDPTKEWEELDKKIAHFLRFS